MKKSVILVSMMAAMAPFGLQALSLTINGTQYSNVTIDSVITTQTGVTIIASDPNNEIGGGNTNPGDPQAPNPFGFTPLTGVALSTLVQSPNTVTVGGIDNPPSAISVTGGSYQINGGAWTSAAGTVGNGDTVRVQHTSSASNNTQTNTSLTIGGVSGLFRSTTEAAAGACGPLPANVELTTEVSWADPGSQVRIALLNQTKSTRFVSTGNPGYEGQVSIGATAGNGNVTREVWISPCPGTSYEQAPSTCKRMGTTNTVVRWHQNTLGRFCALDLNTEYYINVRNMDCQNRETGSACDVFRMLYTNGNS